MSSTTSRSLSYPSARLQRAAQSANLKLPPSRPINAFDDLRLRIQWEQVLASAAERLDLEMVQELVKPIEQGGMGLRACAKDKDGTPALVLACGSDDPPEDVLPVVDALLAAGADVNQVNSSDSNERTSALIAAAMAENIPVLRRLVAENADLHYCDSENHNVLVAAIFSQPQTLQATIDLLKERLGEKGYCDYARTSGFGALHAATKFGLLDSMDVLVASGVGVDMVNGRGQRPVEVAAEACYSKQNIDGLRHLLKMGPEIRPRTWRPGPPSPGTNAWKWATPQAMWLLMLHETPERWLSFTAEQAGFAPGVPVTRLAAAMHLGQPDALTKMVEDGNDIRLLQREAMAISAASMGGKHAATVTDAFALVGASLAGRVLRDVASLRAPRSVAA